MVIVANVLSIAGAALFLFMCVQYFLKEKYPTSILFGTFAAFFILCTFPWFQGLAKTWIVSNVNSKLADLGSKLDEVQKTSVEMQSQLEKHQKQIDTNQTQLSLIQVEIIRAQSQLLAQQKTNEAYQASLTVVQTNLVAQAEGL